jgi:hypothetical protein
MAYSQHPDYVDPRELYTSYPSYADEADLAIKCEFPVFTDPPYASGHLDGLPVSNDFMPSHHDSAVDLKALHAAAYPLVKTEDPTDYDSFFSTQYSTPASATSNTSQHGDQHGDMIFSNANSPGDYTRDQSQTSSPEAHNDIATKDSWNLPVAHPPKVNIYMDKVKTRAETQIKTTVILDPLPRRYQFIGFGRYTLSKSKQLASADEVIANEEGDATLRVDLTLVLATALDSDARVQRALRRARDEETTPSRSITTPVSEIDKDDPAHPQNGGAVIICDGCKERERKRYDRKKKRNPDEEDEWNSYEDRRIIMINEKEYKRWQDVEAEHQSGAEAKKVEFAMRITCYCRHQEEKSPVGYKVIFTFRDTKQNVVVQKISDLIQITDDHKNREAPAPEPLTTELSINLPGRLENMPSQYTPMYNTYASGYSMYSQPSTPVLAQFANAISPMDTQFPQNAHSLLAPQASHQSAFMYGGGAVAAPTPVPSYATHQRYQSYSNTPTLSPTDQYPPQVGYPLQRGFSLESFNTMYPGMQSQQNMYSQPFASQPPSRNVSRPASPSWIQGPASARAKKIRGTHQVFMFGDGDAEHEQ